MTTELQQPATKVAAQNGRMATRQAEYKTDIARLAENMARRETDNY